MEDGPTSALISKLRVMKSRVRVERLWTVWGHWWRSLWLLVCLIKLVSWCGGEVKVRKAAAAATTTPHVHQDQHHLHVLLVKVLLYH